MPNYNIVIESKSLAEIKNMWGQYTNGDYGFGPTSEGPFLFPLHLTQLEYFYIDEDGNEVLLEDPMRTFTPSITEFYKYKGGEEEVGGGDIDIDYPKSDPLVNGPLSHGWYSIFDKPSKEFDDDPADVDAEQEEYAIFGHSDARFDLSGIDKIFPEHVKVCISIEIPDGGKLSKIQFAQSLADSYPSKFSELNNRVPHIPTYGIPDALKHYKIIVEEKWANDETGEVMVENKFIRVEKSDMFSEWTSKSYSFDGTEKHFYPAFKTDPTELNRSSNVPEGKITVEVSTNGSPVELQIPSTSEGEDGYAPGWYLRYSAPNGERWIDFTSRYFKNNKIVPILHETVYILEMNVTPFGPLSNTQTNCIGPEGLWKELCISDFNTNLRPNTAYLFYVKGSEQSTG